MFSNYPACRLPVFRLRPSSVCAREGTKRPDIVIYLPQKTSQSTTNDLQKVSGFYLFACLFLLLIPKSLQEWVEGMSISVVCNRVDTNEAKPGFFQSLELENSEKARLAEMYAAYLPFPGRILLPLMHLNCFQVITINR